VRSSVNSSDIDVALSTVEPYVNNMAAGSRDKDCSGPAGLFAPLT
jgi:hypothetical protein